MNLNEENNYVPLDFKLLLNQEGRIDLTKLNKSISENSTYQYWTLTAPNNHPLSEGKQFKVYDAPIESLGLVKKENNTLIIFSDSSKKEATVFNHEEREIVAVLEGHDANIVSITTVTGHHMVITGDFGGTVKVWNDTTGDWIRDLQQAGPVSDMTELHNGWLMVSDIEGIVKCWEVDTGNNVKTYQFPMNGQGHYSLTRLNFDNWAAIASDKSAEVKVFDISNGDVLRTINTGNEGNSALANDPIHGYLMVGGVDGQVRIYEADTGNHIKTLDAVDSPIRTIKGVGDVLTVVSRSGEVSQYNLRSFNNISFRHEKSSTTLGACILDDGTVIRGDDKGFITIYESELELDLTFRTFFANNEGNIKYTARLMVCDTADTGDNYLCEIYGLFIGDLFYVFDVYYTQDAIEVTEAETARRLIKYKINTTYIEANSAGRSFSVHVEEILRREYKWFTVTFLTFQQKGNKETRIYSQSGEVNRRVIMPFNWRERWPEFYMHVMTFQKKGKNKYDDGPDTLTMCVEYMDGSGFIGEDSYIKHNVIPR